MPLPFRCRPLMLVVVAVCAVASAQPDVNKQGRRPGLVVLCPAQWTEAIDPYLAVRKDTFEARCVAFEDILGAAEGADAPERIKRYLYQQWRDQRLRYALLVGDADTFPVRWMVLDRNTEAAHNYAFYASDLYYADLAHEDGEFDDWNGARDGFHGGYFGEVRGEHFKEPPINYDGISYVPEIAVGRWPVSTVGELRAVVAKTVRWEKRAWEAVPRALIAHADGWVDVRERVGSMGDGLAGRGWDVERQFYGKQTGMPTRETVKASLMDGRELVLHAGHGTGDSWAGCLSTEDGEALADAPAGIYMSVGCGTAHFAAEPPYQAYLDVEGISHRGTNAGESFAAPPPPPASLQPGRYNSTGLGERLLRMPRGGAVAYIGCNTGAQPCAVTLMDGFARSIAAGSSRVGDAWVDALAGYWRDEKLAELVPTEDWYPPSIFFQGMKFMLFGDPALSLPQPAGQ